MWIRIFAHGRNGVEVYDAIFSMDKCRKLLQASPDGKSSAETILSYPPASNRLTSLLAELVAEETFCGSSEKDCDPRMSCGKALEWVLKKREEGVTFVVTFVVTFGGTVS
jgi:hypothetical protein